jgi:hypothetical protein
VPRTNAAKAARAANTRHVSRGVPEGTRRGNTSQESFRGGRRADNARNSRLMRLFWH